MYRYVLLLKRFKENQKRLEMEDRNEILYKKMV